VRVTERGVLTSVLALGVVATAVMALVSGELEGYEFPGDYWIPALGLAVPGLIIVRAHPGHAVGRILLWGGVIWTVFAMFGQAILTFGWEDEALHPIVRAVLSQAYLLPVFMLFAAIARFPDGRWASPWVQRAFWVLAGTGVFNSVWSVSDPSSVDYEPTLDGVRQLVPEWVADVVAILAVVTALAYVVGIIVPMVRDARVNPIHRRQYAWVILALLLFFAVNLIPGIVDSVGLVTLLFFPISIVVAITRYKLYEIDRIFSRTITYVVVVGALVAMYFGLVLGLRTLLPAESPLAVALSTLAVAFAFFPLARRVQAFVDRRFFRSRYDAATVVASFASELRGTIDEAAVVGRAEAVVDEVFAPEAVGVWLAGDPT